MKNNDLKQKYDEMHRKGSTAWFDDGKEERQAILKMGEPWQGKRVLEVGCGEGELLDMLDEKHAMVTGIDYSLEAITRGKKNRPWLDMMCCSIEEYPFSRNDSYDILVMQGVLEHMDDWEQSLSDMISRFKPSTVITSMPAFLNIRGIIWHTLDMLGAVMSKTDLHYIDLWDIEEFCVERGYSFRIESINKEWGNGRKMIEDLKERIPLAIKDGNLPLNFDKLWSFLDWLGRIVMENESCHPTKHGIRAQGAVNIYRIDT